MAHSLSFNYCAEFAGLHTNSALDAKRFIYNVRLFYISAYCTYGTFSRTGGATAASVLKYLIRQKRLTYACRTFLVNHVSHILVTEEFKSGEHRIRSRLTESSKGICLDVMAELLKLVKVPKRCVARCYLFEHFKQAFCADATRRTFAA